MRSCGYCGETKSNYDFYRNHCRCKDCCRTYKQQRWASVIVYNSRSHDAILGREHDDSDDFVTADAVKHMLMEQDAKCISCKCRLLFGIGVNRQITPDAVTIERINNELPHTKSNCVLSCRRCNAIRQDRVPYDVMLEHGAALKAGRERFCSGCKRCFPSTSQRCEDCVVERVV